MADAVYGHRLLDPVDQQGITRGPADPLAQPVDHPPGQDAGPRHGKGDEDLAQRRHAIAGGDERPLTESITDRSDRDLGQ